MIPTITVTAKWVRGTLGPFWQLTTTQCPFCNAKSHRHGGSDTPEPSLGQRGSHCTTFHKVFRPDCKPEGAPGQRVRCKVEHGTLYELVLASPLRIELGGLA